MQSSNTQRTRKDFLVLATLLAVLAITVLAYLPGMSAGYYFDDEPNLSRLASLNLADISWKALGDTLGNAWAPTRPVANLSFALTDAISGTDPAPYHWTNLSIHLLVGLSLYWLLRLFQKHHSSGENRPVLPILITLVFLVHPLNVQAVTYVVQRMTSMSALFFLLAFASYVTGRFCEKQAVKIFWLSLTAVFFMLSIGSKEIGIAFLPLIVTYEACFHREYWRNWFKKNATLRGTLILSSITIAILAFVFSSFWPQLATSTGWFETFPNRDFSGYERVLTQGRVHVFYLLLLIWPANSRLNLDHEFVVSRSLLDPVSTAFALAGWLLVLIFAVRTARNRPLLAFPILAYLLLHAIESAPLNLELVFEHRMYLPMTMLALGVGLNVDQLLGRNKPVGYTTILVIALVLATGTYERNRTWADPLVFLKDCARKSPSKWRPAYNLGTALGQEGQYDEAYLVLKRALELSPNNSETHNQLANVWIVKGESDLAEEHYRLAIKYDPTNAQALYNLAMLVSKKGRHEEQRKLLEEFVRHAPIYLEREKQWAINFLRRQPVQAP
jgi:tetratricopeptide (TPR) repeat protein